MERHHAKEEDVKVISNIKKAGEKKKAWSYLTKKGDFEYNQRSIFQGNTENLCVVRQSDNDINEYAPCLYCQGMFHSRRLFVHSKKCHLRPTGEKVRKPLESGR